MDGYNKIKFGSKLVLLTFWAAVDSNETLYGGDPKFLSEINKLCETLIGQILDHLKGLSRDEVTKLPETPEICHRTSLFFMVMRHKCFLKYIALVFAAEYTASRCSCLFLVWCPVGSWRPEEQ